MSTRSKAVTYAIVEVTYDHYRFQNSLAAAATLKAARNIGS